MLVTIRCKVCGKAELSSEPWKDIQEHIKQSHPLDYDKLTKCKRMLSKYGLKVGIDIK